jgi:hypothetical protein
MSQSMSETIVLFSTACLIIVLFLQEAQWVIDCLPLRILTTDCLQRALRDSVATNAILLLTGLVVYTTLRKGKLVASAT